LSKKKWEGVDICLFIVIVITHRRFSIINNGRGVETDPPGYPGASCFGGGGVKQTTGGFNPPAIQTLLAGNWPLEDISNEIERGLCVEGPATEIRRPMRSGVERCRQAIESASDSRLLMQFMRHMLSAVRGSILNFRFPTIPFLSASLLLLG
jgi:hypothetical protein